MNYFDAESIYQEFCVDMSFAETLGKTREQAAKKFAAKYTREEFTDCVETLLAKLDKDKETRYQFLKLVLGLKKEKGK